MNFNINLLEPILIISPEPWSGHFVSKHHYAITLASHGIQVYFYGPPEKDGTDIEINKTEYKGVYEIKAPCVARGLRFYPSVLKRKVERKWLKNLEKKIGKKLTTIWLFENSRFYDMDFAKDKLKIYHQVDSNQSFHISKAASTADICFCTTEFIKNELLKFNPWVYKIHHGVAENPKILNLNKKQLKQLSKFEINVVLVGNMDIRFLDLELLHSLLKEHPTIGFHFVGGYKEGGPFHTLSKSHKNSILWNKVKSQLIPKILSQCDMSLLVYKSTSKQDTEQLASPHKIMEYLACGNTTIASYTDEYKDKRDLVEMVDATSNFIELFNKVIDDLDYYNRDDKRSLRKTFAKDHTYTKQLGKILNHLHNHKLID